MKLSLSYSDLGSILEAEVPSSDLLLSSIAFDTRRISNGKHVIFFAFPGEFRDGHDFIADAYEKGVRTFAISKKVDTNNYPGATFILVEDTLRALQKIAKSHREKFACPVIGITGSSGKTIVKEWLGQLLDSKYRVVRSPKSYNSQLGVALSILEISENADIAIIEAGISYPGDMEALEQMIQPTHGIFTSLGLAHSQNFESKDVHLAEKMTLFKNCKKVFVHHSITVFSKNAKFVTVHEKSYKTMLESLPFDDEISRHNASLVIAASREFDMEDEAICEQLSKLDRIALRLETFDGLNNCIIINDTYNLDLDAFRSSLEFQLSLAKGKPRVVVIGTNSEKDALKKILADFEPIEYHFVNGPRSSLPEFENSVILIKGKRSLHMEQLALQLRAKKHQTFLEINLAKLRNNISYFKSLIPSETKILCMVKASSYGSGIDEIGKYLEHIGVNYLGVAYADEGVELRQAGVQLPILVMNAEEAGFQDCIDHKLEPCIYSLDQLDKFIRRLIYEGISDYPIHIKLETGMNRLGFTEDKIPSLVGTILSQPEIRIQSIYSHLATSDNPDSNFVAKQIERFNSSSEMILNQVPYKVDRHILNSEGVLNFSQHHFEMVRLGIGMYGHTENENHKKGLHEVIRWYSQVSQVRHIKANIPVGYGNAGTSNKDTHIAIIPVGYADGFRRSLSQGKGGVYIQDKWCPIIGNVCMDMIMVDIGDHKVKESEMVEIIGDNQTLVRLAEKMDTIPYEVLTSISKRVHRVYVDA